MGILKKITPPAFSAGVDEVGRGALAGPVLAGAVVIDPEILISGLKDSKKCSPRKRELLAREIKKSALAWGIGSASSAEIDSLNILRASHLAMQRAVAAMSFVPKCIYVDGHLVPEFDVPAFSVIKGDDRVDVISAGAIIAKVERDRIMRELDIKHPGFGWSQNKGYPTKAHLQALVKNGPVADHRITFKPVKDNLTVGVQSTKRSS